MAPGAAKLSLLAQYDDLCRYTSVLTEGLESDFIKFLKKLENYENNKKVVEIEIMELQKQLSKAKAEIGGLETKLKHARHRLEVEMKKRSKAENDRNILERQISLIREVLLADQNAMNDQTKEKLAFLNSTYCPNKNKDSPKRLQTIDESAGSVLSPSDVSFDKTDDDLESRDDVGPRNRRSRGKRSSRSTNNETSIKRRKSQEIEEVIDGETSVIATTTVSFPKSGDVIAKAKIETVPTGRVTRSRRFISEPAPPSDNNYTSKSSSKSESDKEQDSLELPHFRKPSAPFQDEPAVSKTPITNKIIRPFSSAGKLNNRAHAFCTKTVIRPETCSPCGRRIKFYKQALKCQDCRATCHPECKDKVPLPCVPVSHTPTNKGTMGVIADYTPMVPPMVPALIVHCIKEIESRGMSEVGLYRVSGSDKEVRELKEKFLRGKGVPNLSKADIHVLCGTIKEFLRTLQEPLITRSTWLDFVNASEMKDNEDSQSGIYQAVSQLPRPNRDTLSYVILHLQKVAESPECKMPTGNLAKVFGPTIVGFSVPDPPMMDMITETKKQHKVMERLLTISSDYWNNFVNYPDENIFSTVPKTPERRPVPAGSMLGPLPGSNRDSLSKKSRGVLGKTPLTPRNTNNTKNSTRRRQFFASPMIK
ncbi:rac GTPase-activating protein 1-like [Centruroides vittatus]|uniref:rac GTPase-activating protein 1-like n=1 Tax=Centruroides vittatus TaxID=120091 RepID=UPI00350EF06C